MIEVNSKELPKGWCWVQHKDIATINPKLPFNNLGDTTLVSFVPMSAVEAVCGKYDLSQVRKFGEVKKGYTPFIDSDLIFAKITPCMENGKIAVLENLTNGVGFGSTEFHVSRLTSLTHKKYLFYFFTQKAFRRDAQQHMTGSAGQLRVPKTYFEQIFIPLPPRSEQNRIVEKIEELFSDLDKGIESLKTTQQQLKIYRQAVLKWAFEGRLTAKWREEKKQQGELKSAEELLVQIKAEREKRDLTQLQEWNEAVKTWEANRKQGKKPGKPKKAKELPFLTENEIAELPKLPHKWCWVNFGELVSEGLQNGLYKPASHYSSGVLIVRIDNFYDGKLNSWTTLKRLQVSDDELETYRLEDNDILINRVNSMTHIGKCALIEKTGEYCVFESNIMRLKIFIDFINPKFITYYLSSIFGLKELRKNAKQAINQASINQTDVRLSRVPLCSIEEQHQIVEEIEFRLSICDRLEATITENLIRAEALRQSILKQAFEGKLVPQDPNDEPAEQLIERIRQEKLHGKNGKQLELEIFVDGKIE